MNEVTNEFVIGGHSDAVDLFFVRFGRSTGKEALRRSSRVRFQEIGHIPDLKSC